MTTAGSQKSGLTVLEYVAIGAVAVALAFAFFTPPEVTQGQVARLFYLHLPSIGAAYLAFFGSLIASVFYLITKRRAWDSLAVAAAEVGVLFTFFTIVVGMIWAKPTWGVYWTWSPRLTLTAIMLFVYIGYQALRRAIAVPGAHGGPHDRDPRQEDSRRRARRARDGRRLPRRPGVRATRRDRHRPPAESPALLRPGPAAALWT